MSKYFGDIAEDSTIEIPFNTYNADGASVTFTGTTVKVYKDSATGTEVTTGVTLSKDHDGIVGAHLVTIITTDAFYATGSDYLVELQAATIATQTVNSFIGSFSIENRFMRGTDGANTITPLTSQQVRNAMRLVATGSPAQVDSIDTFLTTIVTDVDGLDGDAMRGTDSANTVIPPSVAQFNARTLLAAAYTIVSDLGVVQSADNDTKLSTIISTGSAGPWTTGGGGDATKAKQDEIIALGERAADVQEGDNVLDKTTTPWSRKTKTKGTATVLLKKILTDIDGVDVTTTEQIIATETDATP